MGNKGKRKHSQYANDDTANQPSLASIVAQLQHPDPLPPEQENGAKEGDDTWTVVGKSGKKRKTNNYPALVYNELHKQQSIVKISDLQQLLLYCLADGTSPQWISVRHHFGVKKAVVLFVPGLEQGMFDGSVSLDMDTSHNVPSTVADQQPNGVSHSSPDDYVPVRLITDDLPQPLRPLAGCFEHLWPVRAPGDDRMAKVFSPLHAMLNAPIPKSQDQKDAEKNIKGAKPANGHFFASRRTPITHFISSKDELMENDFLLHPVWFDTENQRATEAKRRREAKQTTEHGWVDSRVESLEKDNRADQENGSLSAGHTILAMDCEMCKVDGDDAALTRISLVGWDGEVVMDELVKPDKPVIDYLTRFSGITAEKLDPVTTTLADVQSRLLELLTPSTILVGHSLNSDLDALKISHPFIVDTSILYQHPRGPPLKSSLKWLAQKYLSREIQKGHGTIGHDSIEDSQACLDLVKLKCEKGPDWGSSASNTETIFKRLSRTPKTGKVPAAESSGVGGKIGAIIDHGNNFGNMAGFCIDCNTNADVVDAVKRAVMGDADGAYIPGGGVDFTWARMRELEALRGWSNNHRYDSLQMDKSADTNDSDSQTRTSELAAQVANTVSLIHDVHASLPPCTLLVVYSGTGDPRDLARMQQMQRTFKTEYKTKKWDELSVRWTDVEEQALKRACKKARQGVGFVTIT
ncbi:MAG: hypothetical protein Q9220_001761 [cf. Caloplaca sp. 1 TL-2023]